MSNQPIIIAKTNQIIKSEFQKIVDDIILRKDSNDFNIATFNTKDLSNHNNYNEKDCINQKPDFWNSFKVLDSVKKNNCLYWFELENEKKADELNSLLNSYRLKWKQEGVKKVPTTNRNTKSKIIYVGIRQGGYRKRDDLTNITGRIMQHLGYYKEGATQGLQLYEYARSKDFNITLKVVQFEGLEYSAFLNIIEKLVAEKLRPLCGRH